MVMVPVFPAARTSWFQRPKATVLGLCVGWLHPLAPAPQGEGIVLQICFSGGNIARDFLIFWQKKKTRGGTGGMEKVTRRNQRSAAAGDCTADDCRHSFGRVRDNVCIPNVDLVSSLSRAQIREPGVYRWAKSLRRCSDAVIQ